MRLKYAEFAIKKNVWGTPKGNLVPLIDVTFTPIYEVTYKGHIFYFKTFKLRAQAIEGLSKGLIFPNSTFEYIEGLKVYTELK